MIEKVKNFSYKSWNNYTGPKDNFAQKNILFGYNGKGKSALAHGILQEIRADISDNEEMNYRLFDKDYVQDNLLLQDSDNIQGVVANFGKEDVGVEKLVAEKEKEKQDTTKLDQELNENERKIKEEINRILSNKRGKSQIKKKPTDDVEKILGYYDQDLCSAKKIVNSDEELKDVQSTEQYEEELEAIRSVQIPDFSLPDEGEVEEIGEIMINSYNDNVVPTNEIIEWISEGLSIHKERNESICQFCGGPLDLDEIQNRLTTFLDDRKQQDQARLKKLYTNISAVVDYKNKKIDDDKVLYMKIISADAEEIFKDINDCLNVIEKGCFEIEEKFSDFNVRHEFNTELINKQIGKINDNIDKLKAIKKEKEIGVQENINKFSILLKGAIALEIKNSSLINDSFAIYRSKKKELMQIKQRNQELEQEIIRLKNSKSTTSDFAKFLNEILADLDVGFSLMVNGQNYIIKNKKDNKTLTVNDISEGEVNLLALLIFYYELFEDDNQKKFKSHVKYIIIDDPISSIDDINRIYILELLKNILECSEPQIFIFTHVWEDFVDLCYGREDKKENIYRYYEVVKDSTSSYLKQANSRETPYMHDFKEIYNLSLKESAEDMNDCEIYHYPNVMRKVLEEFMKLKVVNANPTRSNIHNVEIALCGDVNNITHQDRQQIPALLDTCNILSHRSKRNPEQILKSAKYLMRKIKEVDSNHFHAMTGA